MEVPPGPLGPPPDYEAALALGPAPPPTNPIGPRGTADNVEPPPDYFVAASLPSYEQAEQLKEKLLSGDVEEQREEPAPRRSRRSSQRDDWEGEEDMEFALLGNDFVFFTAFLTAFLFNWVSFLRFPSSLYCFFITDRLGLCFSCASVTQLPRVTAPSPVSDSRWRSGH